jgi:hypothetical protein
MLGCLCVHCRGLALAPECPRDRTVGVQPSRRSKLARHFCCGPRPRTLSVMVLSVPAQDTRFPQGSRLAGRQAPSNLVQRQLGGFIGRGKFSRAKRDALRLPRYPRELSKDRHERRRVVRGRKAGTQLRPDGVSNKGRVGSKAAVATRSPDVCLSPDSGGKAHIAQPPLWAKCGLMPRSNDHLVLVGAMQASNDLSAASVSYDDDPYAISCGHSVTRVVH